MVNRIMQNMDQAPMILFTMILSLSPETNLF